MNKVFLQAISTNKIASAYMVEGVCEQTRSAVVHEFLNVLFCENKTACTECSSCIKFNRESHVDMLYVRFFGKSVKVDAVREIGEFISKKSFEGGYKAVYIQNADDLTESAANALLKMLEEPPKDTVFVLGVDNAKRMLPTILSRCVVLTAQMEEEDAQKKLQSEFSLSTLKAGVLLNIAQKDFYLAQKMAEQDYFSMREDMVLVLSRMFYAKSMATSAIKKIIFKYENQLKEAFAVALIYIQDVLYYKYTNEEKGLLHYDKAEEIKKHAYVSARVLVHIAQKINDWINKSVSCSGLNRKLSVDGMLFEILEEIV